MVKEHLEKAVKEIENERERQTAVLRDKIMREKIAPYNAEIDQKRTRALAEIDNELNAKIVELKQAYEAKKAELVKLGEENKKANAENVLATELAVVTVEYDSAIAKLKAQIAEIEG